MSRWADSTWGRPHEAPPQRGAEDRLYTAEQIAGIDARRREEAAEKAESLRQHNERDAAWVATLTDDERADLAAFREWRLAHPRPPRSRQTERGFRVEQRRGW